MAQLREQQLQQLLSARQQQQEPRLPQQQQQQLQQQHQPPPPRQQQQGEPFWQQDHLCQRVVPQQHEAHGKVALDPVAGSQSSLDLASSRSTNSCSSSGKSWSVQGASVEAVPAGGGTVAAAVNEAAAIAAEGRATAAAVCRAGKGDAAHTLRPGYYIAEGIEPGSISSSKTAETVAVAAPAVGLQEGGPSSAAAVAPSSLGDREMNGVLEVRSTAVECLPVGEFVGAACRAGDAFDMVAPGAAGGAAGGAATTAADERGAAVRGAATTAAAFGGPAAAGGAASTAAAVTAAGGGTAGAAAGGRTAAAAAAVGGPAAAGGAASTAAAVTAAGGGTAGAAAGGRTAAAAAACAGQGDGGCVGTPCAARAAAGCVEAVSSSSSSSSSGGSSSAMVHQWLPQHRQQQQQGEREKRGGSCDQSSTSISNEASSSTAHPAVAAGGVSGLPGHNSFGVGPYSRHWSPATATATGGCTLVSSSDSDVVTLSRAEYELLRLKEKAMESIQEGIAIADARLPDQPLIHVNEGFCRISGYSREEVLGKNCRFLQVGFGLWGKFAYRGGTHRVLGGV